MAIGFNPHATENLYFETFTPQQFLTIAVDTVNQLGWRIELFSETGFIAYLNNGVFKWNARVTFKMDDEKAILESASLGTEMFDMGRNRKTLDTFTSVFAELKYTLTPEELAQKYEVIEPTLVPKEQDVLGNSGSGRQVGFFALFIPREGYFITPLIADLNILVFIVMVISGVNILQPSTQALISWGANFRPITLSGQWWRLLTNCFLHIGIFHLLFNMYALFYIGLLLEPRLGKAKFTAAYLITGVIASVTSLGWHDLTVSAGASGAIFGLYGVFLAMLTTNLIAKSARTALLTSIGIFVVYNLMNGMKGGIDNAAHIGGLVSGLIIGYAYYMSLKEPGSQKLEYSTIGLLAVLALVSSFGVMHSISNDIPVYEAKMKKFTSNESQALEVFKMLKYKPREKLMAEIKDRDMYYWNENVQLIQDAEKLNLPALLHERNSKLLDYCDLRIKSYNFMYKSLEENTSTYKDSLIYYNQQIKILIDELKR